MPGLDDVAKLAFRGIPGTDAAVICGIDIQYPEA
jgi:hypothetical protein